MKIDHVSRQYHARGVGGRQSAIKAVVIHSAEAPFGAAEGVARFLETRTDGGAHFVFDDNSGYRLANDSTIAYGVGGFNTGVIHIEQTGYAGMKKVQWLRHPKQLARVAFWTAKELRKHGLKPRRLQGRTEIFRGGGYVYHRDVSPYVTSTHTDPGPNFPVHVFGAMVRFFFHHPKAKRPD